MNNYVFMVKKNLKLHFTFNIWYSIFKNVGEGAELRVLSFLMES